MIATIDHEFEETGSEFEPDFYNFNQVIFIQKHHKMKKT
jgi:hypothetical protein